MSASTSVLFMNIHHHLVYIHAVCNCRVAAFKMTKKTAATQHDVETSMSNNEEQ
jgi:hypothetical protein